MGRRSKDENERNSVTADLSQPQHGTLDRNNRVIIVFALALVLFLAALDVTIITTALPTISNQLRASEDGFTWIGSSFVLANATSSSLWGKLSDIWGRKIMLVLANVIFMIGSLICALSNTAGLLISGRAIQGVGSGGIVVLVNTCIGDLFSVRDRAQYFGILGMVWALASAIGPIIGGAFTEKLSWRWCFYINCMFYPKKIFEELVSAILTRQVPLDGVALVALVFFFSIETQRMSPIQGLKAIDWTGILTITGGTLMFLLGLQLAGTNAPWSSTQVISLLVFGPSTIFLFLLNEWKLARHPIVPIHIFQDRSNLAAFAITFVHGAVFIAGNYFMPLYFQTVLSASPILSGVYLLPQVLALSIISGITGLVIRKTGYYLGIIRIGMALMALGYGLFIEMKPYESWSRLITYQIIAGVGGGMNFEAPLIALYAVVNNSDMATTTSTFGFVRQLAEAVSIVIGGVIFQSGLRNRENSLISRLGSGEAKKLLSSPEMTVDDLNHFSIKQRALLSEVYTESLSKMWIFYTALAVFGIVLSLFVVGCPLDDPEPPESMEMQHPDSSALRSE